MIHFMESISQPISAAPYPASNWCHFAPLFVSLGDAQAFPIYLSLSVYQIILHKIFINTHDWNPNIIVRQGCFFLLPVLCTTSFFAHSFYMDVCYLLRVDRHVSELYLWACQHQGEMRFVSYKSCRL